MKSRGTWIQVACTAIGLWLMAAPAVLGYGAPASTADRILGPIIASWASIAITAATRGAHWVNVPLGLALVVLPFILGYPTAALLNSTVCGVVVTALSMAPARVKSSFGGGWASLLPGREPAGLPGRH